MPQADTDEDADLLKDAKRCECRDCDRSWEGSGTEAIAEAHAARYDHRVTFTRQVIFGGTVERDG